MKTATLENPSSIRAEAGHLPQLASDSIIFVQSNANTYSVRTYNNATNGNTSAAIMSWPDNYGPAQIAEDVNTVYLSVMANGIGGSLPDIYRSAKTTTDGSYITMIDSLTKAPKIVVANNLLYYTAGPGIYTLPLNADKNAVTPATPTLIIGAGADSDNISDFIFDGTTIYYLTGGVGSYGMEADDFLSILLLEKSCRWLTKFFSRYLNLYHADAIVS